MTTKQSYFQFYLRLALSISFLLPGLDRLGVWGPHGKPWVSWGDWAHFSAFARQVMGFLPAGLANVLAVLATIGEIGCGVLLLIGFFTRQAAVISGVLTLGFALSMWISFGVTAPFSYSVFTVSAASFLLSTLPEYKWSVDGLRAAKRN